MKKAIFTVAVAALVLVPAAAGAQVDPSNLDLGINYAANIGLGTADIRDTIAQIIQVLMGLLGTIAVIIILYGGFMWMTSGGDQTKVDNARKIIIAGVIGLIIILAAYAIANFVISEVLQATTQ